MGPNERRKEIMETLCQRRHETMKNLAFQFGVSVRTIKNDIDILSLSYPLITMRGRYGGGVKVIDGFNMNRKYLNPQQQELLERLCIDLSGNDLAVMNSIIKDFALAR
jgi:DeoR/GlpR family transcriptional regulator of sugar metabolism